MSATGKTTTTRTTGKTNATNVRNGPIDFKDFKVSELSFSDIDFSPAKKEKGKISYNTSQYISFPRYKDELPTFRAGWLQFTSGGIPKLGEYYKSDENRDFVKVPLIEEKHLPEPYKGNPFTPEELLYRRLTIQTCAELRRGMTEIDRYIIKNKSKILGKFAEKFEYQPIVRTPQKSDDLDEEKEGMEVEKPDYMKFKLMTNFETKELQTAVYTCEEIDESGKAINTMKTDVKTVTDLCEYHNFLCVSRYIFRMVKLWAARNANKDTGKRMFGVSFKICQILVKPSVRRPGGNMEMGFGFDDDCVTMDDSELNNLVGDENATTRDEEVMDEEVEREERDDEVERVDDVEVETGDDSGDDTEEEVPPPPPKKTTRKTPAKKSTK